MRSLTTVIDNQQRYVANIISKHGRNEIQIYPVEQIAQAGDEDLTSTNLAVRIELEAEEQIERVRWVQDIDSVVGKKKGSSSRKRNAEDKDIAALEDSEGSLYLLAILLNGNIICISPNSNQILTTIENGDESHKIHDLVSYNTSTVWTIGENGKLREVVLTSGKVKKEIQLSNFDNDNTSHIASIKKSARQSMLLLGSSSSLYLVDPAKKKPIVDTEASQEASITQIVESIVRPDHVYVTREDSKTIEVYQVTPTNIASINTITIEGEAVAGIRLFSLPEEKRELLLALSSEGVEVFSIDNNEVKTLNTIATNVSNHPLVTFVPQKNASGYMGLWYDGNEPRFAKFDTDFTDDVEIAIVQATNGDVEMSTSSKDETVLVPESTKVLNLDSDKLLSQLQGFLHQEESDQVNAEIIELCETNDDEDRIKEMVQILGSSTLATKLFVVVSRAVASDPAKGNSLSLWLKWILLANGGHIAKQPEQYENVKNLQHGLSEGMKMIPRLLALQGRLQLLKAQADLRSRIGSNDNLDLEETNIINNSSNSNDADTLLYANGEDDDDEYAEDSDTGMEGKKAEVFEIEGEVR